jgi:hypothetical protein
MEKFIWDTNSLIKMHNDYNFDSSWVKFEEYCKKGQFQIHQEVRNELNGRLDEDDEDEYTKFLTKFGCFLDNKDSYSAANQEIVKQIALRYGYQDLFDNATNKSNWADPWIIAHAKNNIVTIITDESQKPEKRRIPAIAKNFNVKILTTFEFLKSQNWF